ncbi:MAG: hypothetical protein KKB50_06135 [Planctomycetes bacterium]|nr:hypothetical protein [Planctomycetota bacterium]
MSKRYAAAIYGALCLATSAYGTNFIEECGGLAEPDDYHINHLLGVITILEPGIYKFHAHDNGGLGFIDEIIIDGGVTGDVTITIGSCDVAGEPGAQDVGRIYLAHAGAWTATIKELHIAGDFSYKGPTVANQIGDTGSETFDVAGDVLNNIEVTGDIRADIDVTGNIAGNIAIGGLLAGDLSCTTAQDITLNGTGTHTGDITIEGAYSHTIFVADSMAGTIETGPYDGEAEMSGVICSTGDLATLEINGEMTGLIDSGGTIARLRINSGVEHSGSIMAADYLGDAEVSGDLTGWIGVGYLATLRIFGNLWCDIDVAHDLTYLLQCRCQLADSLIHVGGNIEGEILVLSGDMRGAGIEIDGDLNGAYTARKAMRATLTVHGNMPGTITIAGQQPTAHDALMGRIRIEGDMSGALFVGGELYDAYGDMSGGHVIINKSYVLDGPTDITIEGCYAGGAEFVAIDHDGWHKDDTWVDAPNGAKVTVDGNEYAQNTPAAHVWEISECKADMNNDWLVNGWDIDPFILALESTEQYALAYPGLGGSVLFHGDLNCDDVLNGFDIEPLIQRLSEGTCSPLCPGEPGAGRASPEFVADLLLTYVAAERVPTLIIAVDELITYHGNSSLGQYWAAVLQALLA